MVNECKCLFSIPHAGRGDDLADALADIAVDDGLFIGDTATLQELTKDVHLTADLTHFFDWPASRIGRSLLSSLAASFLLERNAQQHAPIHWQASLHCAVRAAASRQLPSSSPPK